MASTCMAEERLMGTVTNASMPVSPRYIFTFTKQASTTYTIPGMVILVSAMFVATMTFRTSAAARSNTAICLS